MPAYLVLDYTITEREQFRRYAAEALPLIHAYGGRHVLRGLHTEVLEGDWQPQVLIIVEFADRETAQRFWHSPEFERVRRLRDHAAETRAVLMEGMPLE